MIHLTIHNCLFKIEIDKKRRRKSSTSFASDSTCPGWDIEIKSTACYKHFGSKVLLTSRYLMRNNYKRIFVTPNNLHGFIRARIFHAEQSLHSDRIPTKYGRDTRFPKRISREKQTNKQTKFEIKREDKNNKKLTKQQQQKKRNTR